MDQDGDGLLSQAEIEEHISSARWYTEKEEAYDMEFAPVLPNLFPLADVGADGKLSVQEVQALLELFDEYSEHGLPHLLGLRRMDGFQRIWAIADNVKWMAQYFAWYAANHMWHGTSEANSQDYANYLQHRESVRLALNGAGVSAGELFSQ